MKAIYLLESDFRDCNGFLVATREKLLFVYKFVLQTSPLIPSRSLSLSLCPGTDLFLISLPTLLLSLSLFLPLSLLVYLRVLYFLLCCLLLTLPKSHPYMHDPNYRHDPTV